MRVNPYLYQFVYSNRIKDSYIPIGVYKLMYSKNDVQSGHTMLSK
jgi:hypothetical protein